MYEVDGIRLKQFRQIRKEIRGSEDYMIVGIDVAKGKNCAFYGTATGKTLLKRMIFENSIEGFEELLTQEYALMKGGLLSYKVDNVKIKGDVGSKTSCDIVLRPNLSQSCDKRINAIENRICKI